MVERTIDECLRARLARREQPWRLATTEEIRASLAAWLGDELGAGEVVDLTRAPGGASKENFFFDYVRDGRREPLLLRLDPGASIVETHRLREFQLLRAAHGKLPAPRPIAVDANGERLGRPAMVMERVSGRPQPEMGKSTSGVGILFEEPLRSRLADDFVAALAALHAIEPASADLSAFDEPKPGTTEAARWNLDWWVRVWEEDRDEVHPVIALAAKWLDERLPIARKTVLVHGDFRSGNFLYEEARGITAILDWELGHLGDPHEDLGWTVNRLFSSRTADGSRLACGLLPRDELLRRYEAATGFRVDPETLRFYEVFTNFKLAVCVHTTTLRVARIGRTHLAAAMLVAHAFAHHYIAELAAALEIGDSRTGGTTR